MLMEFLLNDCNTQFKTEQSIGHEMRSEPQICNFGSLHSRLD